MSHLVSYDNQKIHRNTFKEQLQAGKFVNSFTLSIAHSLEILHLARHAGIQAISLNLEHRKASVETATDVCIMGLALG
jgi:2-keto-3-deoxy-L-rhamnonate aldolase RhmA